MICGMIFDVFFWRGSVTKMLCEHVWRSRLIFNRATKIRFEKHEVYSPYAFSCVSTTTHRAPAHWADEIYQMYGENFRTATRHNTTELQ